MKQKSNDTKWSRLDNAAKIFPAAMSKTDTQVFRLNCELYENVDPVKLQIALDETYKVFEIYHCILRRGLFWYYLEQSDFKPLVREDSKPPCGRIYYKNQKNLLFDVTYFRCRVNIEVYHVLSDGTGAMNFFRTMITKYLSLCCEIDEPYLGYDASQTEMSDDSFTKYYNDKAEATNKKSKPKTACQLKGIRYSEDRLKIITGSMNVNQMLEAAHKYNTTLTIYICACLLDSISRSVTVRMKKKPIVLSVPVNLRKYFPSETARNFFEVIYISFDFNRQGITFDNIIADVSAQFKEKLKYENLAENMYDYSKVENNVFARIVPLYLKDIILKTAYNITARTTTAAISNVGVINMPDKIQDYIHSFEFCSSTRGLQVCVCSYRDTITMSFSSPFISAETQRNFFRSFTESGIDVVITSNSVD